MRRNNILVPGLVLVAVLVCVTVISSSLASGRRSLMHQLERSTPERTFAARLSIRMKYHPCTAVHARGDTTLQREECADRGEGPLRTRELTAARRSSDPDSLQASALSTVIWWDDNEASLDSAILRLQKALRLSPGSVPLLVDLSAAHLLRAERTWNPRDLLQGHNYADMALAREPRNADAQWNAALALQAFGFDWKADEAWAAYLAIDSTSPWADEASQRKSLLITKPAGIPFPSRAAPDSVVAAFAAEYPQQARELGWDSVLSEWGAAVEARNVARADSLLDFAERLGRGLERRPGGDASLADAVRAIRRAAGNPAATVALAQAHRALAEGRTAIKAVHYAEARQIFARVLSLRPPSPVLVQWATMWLSAAKTHSEARLRQLLVETDSTHPVLRGRTRLALGRQFLTDGKYSDAQYEYLAAQDLFRSAGEVESNGQAVSGEGEAAYESGDTVQAYRLMHQAHLALRPYGTQPRHINLMALASRAIQDEMPRTAFVVYNHAIRGAAGTVAPMNVLETFQYRARTRAVLGDSGGAARDLDSALAWLPQLLPDTGHYNIGKALIRVASPGKFSAAAMDSTVTAFSERVLWRIPAFLWRADARLAAGDVDAAILDLDSVTALVHGLSRKESEVRLRAAMIEQVRSRFDQLVMLHLATDSIEQALQALERGRVSFASAGDRTQPLDRLSTLPSESVVEYALIGDTLLAWVLRGRSIHLMRDVVDRDTFLLTVEQVNAHLESPAGDAAARPGLRRLHNWLIHPLRHWLSGTETLVILADNEVAGVPFHALRGEERQRYLIEDYVLRFATGLPDALSARLAERAPSGLVLLVTDPAFDEGDHPILDRLPGARAEVDSLGLLYPGAMVLADRDATNKAFQARAKTASVIHYAGHAVFDDGRPERSYLVLAGADSASRLTAQEISAMDLQGAPLVVLSACRSLRSREGRMDGFAGLSGELLAAGATGVIGSLWQADDELTKPLMVAFHREYRVRRDDPARALRAAQLHMIRLRDPVLSSPAAWAGFRYMGN